MISGLLTTRPARTPSRKALFKTASSRLIVAGFARITVRRKGKRSTSVSVAYATSNGTATAGSDYGATSGTLVFPPGIVVKSFTVPILEDSQVEGSETILLKLGPVEGCAGLVAPDTAVLTITDNDVLPRLQLSTSRYTASEARPSVTITVKRIGGASSHATVDYATSDGTAMAGADYVETHGTLDFAPGVVTRTFTIPIVDDAVRDPGERFSVTLSNPQPPGAAALGLVTTATITITDNDRR